MALFGFLLCCGGMYGEWQVGLLLCEDLGVGITVLEVLGCYVKPVWVARRVRNWDNV
jgi:hypothetical protein